MCVFLFYSQPCCAPEPSVGFECDVVLGVQLYYLSNGSTGVALTSIGAELRRNEVRTISLFWALLTFWVDFRVVLRRSLLYLHANCTVECVMSQSSPSYITVAQSPLGAPQLRTDVRTQFITFANFWHFPGVIAVPAVSWFIWQLALRVLPAVTWLTVYRWLHMCKCANVQMCNWANVQMCKCAHNL